MGFDVVLIGSFEVLHPPVITYNPSIWGHIPIVIGNTQLNTSPRQGSCRGGIDAGVYETAWTNGVFSIQNPEIDAGKE
jgi:hypothetical protein